MNREAWTVGRVRDLSALVFGNMYRLEILAVIASAPGGEVTVHEIAKTLGVSDNNVSPTVRKLREAHLLTDPPHADSRSKLLRRAQTPLWQGIDSFVSQLGVQLQPLNQSRATTAPRRRPLKPQSRPGPGASRQGRGGIQEEPTKFEENLPPT